MLKNLYTGIRGALWRGFYHSPEKKLLQGQGDILENSASPEMCFCPLHGLLDTISKKWALMIIAAIGNHGTAGFNELKKYLCNISFKTLSRTLKELEEEGLISRQVIDQMPPVVPHRFRMGVA